MKVVIIDPVTETVEDAIIGEDYTEIYRVLSWDKHKCDTFDAIQLAQYEVMYVDGEGLLTDLPLWELAGYNQPLAGKGVVMGLDREGGSVSTTITAKKLKPLVTWRPDLECIGFSSSQSVEFNESFNMEMNVFRNIPIFEVKK